MNMVKISYIKIGIVKNQIYKLATTLNILSNLFFIIVQFYLWSAIYQMNSINNYSFKQIFVYFLLGQILSVIYPSNISGSISSLIRSGDIIHHLLKPVRYENQFFFESIGESFYRFYNIVIPVFLVSVIWTGINMNVNLQKALMFLLIISLSYIFVFLFEMIIGLITFYTKSFWGVQSLKYAILTLFTGKLIPFSFFPEKLQILLNNLPFKIAYYVPISFITGKGDIDFLGTVFYQCIFIIITYFIYYLLYKQILKRISIQGG